MMLIYSPPAGRILCPAEIRANVGAAMAARLTGEPRLDIGYSRGPGGR